VRTFPPVPVLVLALTLPLLAASLLSACDERRKSDAELGLTPEQSAGRRIYDDQCDRCHEPYSSHGRKGPSLQGVFQHQFLSKSGLPANDERVTEIILSGRGDMPAFNRALTQDQVNSLLLYLHTL
jgi:mono/diheme cytochrome c family protein